MGDAGLWVAVLTGGTAVIASWVTSRGHTQAARLQAEVAAATQEEARRRETRRASYLAFIEQAHLMGVEYRKTPPLLEIEDPEHRRLRLEEHRERLREVFGPFRHRCQVVALDGPSMTVDAGHRVFVTSRTVYMTLGDIAAGICEPSAYFQAIDDYWTSMSEFVEAVRQEGA
ncbi:hypothetical protein [Streptomyces agglomeratus]|uniref:hypothetical protein n=1 Tax=Streptomyces agglomeratus TaxID=285458 RepID=UPI00114D1147|nr:hypothetical protein [Streptomyces agglomeratus]